MALSFTDARANAMLDTLTTSANSGKLRIYSGTPPADADTALSGNTQLAELTMNATSAPAASGGVWTANAITSDSAADATGTASFFRMLASNGTTVLYQGTVTATGGGGDLELGTVSIVANAVISVSSLTITIP